MAPGSVAGNLGFAGAGSLIRNSSGLCLDFIKSLGHTTNIVAEL